MKTPSPKPTKAASQAKGKGGAVRFEFCAPYANLVCLAGTFNDWHPTASEMVRMADGRWLKDLTLPPGRYEYRLVVDGVWMADPACPTSAPNPHGGENSVLTVSAAASQ